VDVTCLGVVQYIACAAAYPTCSENISSIEYKIDYLGMYAVGYAIWLRFDVVVIQPFTPIYA